MFLEPDKKRVISVCFEKGVSFTQQTLTNLKILGLKHEDIWVYRFGDTTRLGKGCCKLVKVMVDRNDLAEKVNNKIFHSKGVINVLL